MKIYVLNKMTFDSLLKNLNINNDNIEEQKSFFISINDTFSKNKPILENKSNVKVMYFDDVDKDINVPLIGGGVKLKAKAFTNEQAEELYDFIKNQKGKSSCIVHCSAGISRSGAIGTFLCDYFNVNWFEFKKDNPHIHPNNHVLELLKKVHKESG